MGRGIPDGCKGCIFELTICEISHSWDRNLVFELLEWNGTQAAGFGIPEENRGVVISL